MSCNLAAICFRAFEDFLEVITTFLYRELLKRNTLRPMMEIICEPREELQRKLLHQWAQTKKRESSYIQLAVKCLRFATSSTEVSLLIVYAGRVSLHDSGIMLAVA